MKRYEINITGMGCAHCVKSVTEALAGVGAEVLHCEIGKAEVNFAGDPAALAEAVEDRGFAVEAVMEK